MMDVGEGWSEALERLAAALAERGVQACGLRQMPDGPQLTVLVNLTVTHDGINYRWLEGRDERDHPGDDADGAARAIAPLAKRLQGPAFQTPPEQATDITP